MFKASRGPIALLLVILALVSCGTPSPATSNVDPTTPPSSPAAFPASLTDFDGRAVRVAERPQRIVSIGSSNTELLYALGAGDRVVGVDDFSDEPAEAKTKEKVGGVRVSIEKVASLRPDVILTTKFSDGTIERLAAIAGAVVVIEPQSLTDITRSVRLVGQAIGADGASLAARITSRLDAVRQKTSAIAARPRVFHELDASDPAKPFTVGPGSFVHELIELAGGQNIAAGAGSRAPQLSAEELVRSDPEVIVLADADYGVTAEQVAQRPGWGTITAVRTGRIHPISANLVSRPGPRIAEAAEAYARLLHPDAFR